MGFGSIYGEFGRLVVPLIFVDVSSEAVLQLWVSSLRNEIEGFISRATHVLGAAWLMPPPSNRTLCAVAEDFESMELLAPW